MANNRLTKKTRDLFESIRHIDEDGREYWTARELAKALDYADYRNFLDVARKAWTACRKSGKNPNDHFVMFTEMVSLGSNAERQIDNIKISRYACYLTVQNANSSKTIVAQAQTYFAIQTRRAERKTQNILDHMGSTELAANLFRATQTEDKLRREGVKGKDNANRVHKEVGAKVRKTIEELGGTMPEDLPTVDSIKKLERREKRLLEKSGDRLQDNQESQS